MEFAAFSWPWWKLDDFYVKLEIYEQMRKHIAD